MKKGLRSLTIILVSLAVLISMDSCSEEKSYEKLESAAWLIGEWENQSDEGYSVEIWSKQNDSVFVGESHYIAMGDTLFSENIFLEQKENELYYSPVIPDQNQGEAVRFKLTKSTNSELVFENPDHDFPQKITYSKINSDSLFAKISGIIEGEEMSQEFPFSRK